MADRQQLRILHVDDDAGFRDLTQTLLEEEHSRFTVETAASAEEGLERVADCWADCVVSDYDMPGNDGIDFLQAVRETHPELPFILFTGKGSESVASEAIAAGVTDYLQKGSGSEQYELLANRIDNAVEARRDARQSARRKKLLGLTEHAGDTGGWELDLETEQLTLTDGTRRLIGATGDTPLSLADAIELYHPDDQESVQQAIDEVAETGERRRETWRLRTLDGGERYLAVTITPVTADGDVTAIRGAVNDLTRQCECRRELTQTETLFENSQDALFLVDVTDECYRIQRVNPAYEQLTGLTSADLRGETVAESMGADDAAATAARYDRCVRQREPQQYVEELAVPDPESYWETRLAPVVVDGTVEYIAGSTRDITEQRERKQELEANQQFIEQALDSLNDLFYVVDVDGGIRRWNDRMPESTGYDESELAAMQAVDLFPEDEREAVADAIETTVADGRTRVEADLLTADDERIPYELTGVRLTDEDGNATGIVGIGRDLSERRQRERRFQALVENSSDVISVVDADGRYQYQSPSIERILGYDPETTVGNMAWEYIHPDDRDSVRAFFGTLVDTPGHPESVECRVQHADGSWRWMEVRGSEQTDNPAIDGYVVNSHDITEQKRDKQQRQHREQPLRELHAATREFYPPSDESEIAEFLLEFLSGAFDFPYISVKRFDDEANCLQPAARSSSLGATDRIGPVEPGPNPLWSAYEQGDPTTFDVKELAGLSCGTDASIDEGLAVPVGDFGVVVLCAPDDDSIDGVARELLEVVTANAESAFQRLRAAETHADVAAELSAQQDNVEELRTVTGILQNLHADLAAKDTTDALERSVCDHLTRTDRIEFACLYRPEGAKTNLQPMTWAGQANGYLNDVGPGGDEQLPAQCVVGDHEQCSVADIGSRATDADWAKHALTAGFRSVLSVPLVHDGVLYGVLSAYATDEAAFDRTHRDLVANAGSLLVSYSRTLTSRYEGAQRKFTMLEFELSDSAYPFHRLAATTDCRIQVDTVLEATDTEMQLLVTVLDGDPETVLDRAPSVTTIVDADWFGDQSDQLSVRVQKPFLASVVGTHDAVLHDAVSDADGTEFRVRLPRDTPKRPVLASLFAEYQELSPVAQRQMAGPGTLDTTRTGEILTNRQHEVLSAAFHGGYYETPKAVTGAEIAANFGISNSAVHDHLRTANRKLLAIALDADAQYQQ
jgi:PAS domain S-box-containing protein